MDSDREALAQTEAGRVLLKIVTDLEERVLELERQVRELNPGLYPIETKVSASGFKSGDKVCVSEECAKASYLLEAAGHTVTLGQRVEQPTGPAWLITDHNTLEGCYVLEHGLTLVKE